MTRRFLHILQLGTVLQRRVMKVARIECAELAANEPKRAAPGTS
jgi:hypothetical protein